MVQKLLVLCLIFALIVVSTAQWGYGGYGMYPRMGYGYGRGMWGPMGMGRVGFGAMRGAATGARIGAKLGAIGALLGK